MASAIKLAAVFLVGLAVGSVGVYGLVGFAGGSTNSQTSSFMSTSSSISTTSSSSTTSGSGEPQLSQALATSADAALNMTSYNFAKGALTAWIENEGASAIVLTPSECLLNGTLFPGTFFAVTDTNVTKYGVYYFIPPKGTVIVEIPTPTALTGYYSTLQIFNNTWNIKYGTYKD